MNPRKCRDMENGKSPKMNIMGPSTQPDPGFGIVLSRDVVDTFVGLFNVLPRFRLDGVYIGMLANKIGVKPINNPNFELWPDNKNRCRFINSTLVRHTVTGDCLFKVYNEMLSYLSAVKG